MNEDMYVLQDIVNHPIGTMRCDAMRCDAMRCDAM